MLKREHLLDYMTKGDIHLSKKDYGFYTNLNHLIREKNKITSNQNKLFEKLLTKYQRQLRKQGHEIEQLLKLKWDTELVDSAQEYLVPKIYIEQDLLCLRTPFNSKFIQALKRVPDNTFIWDKNSRTYKSKFYTHALKLASALCVQFFEQVDYCEQLKNLIEPLREFDGISFEPTLVLKSGNYYISNINEHLYNATKHIVLDASAECLFQLSLYGVKIDDAITQSDKFLLFASSFKTEIDLDFMLQNMDYFKKLKVDGVIFSAFHHGNLIDRTIKEHLEHNKIKLIDKPSDENVFYIKHDPLNEPNDENIFYIKRTGSLISPRINFKDLIGNIPHTKKVNKIIEITNSRPIEIL